MATKLKNPWDIKHAKALDTSALDTDAVDMEDDDEYKQWGRRKRKIDKENSKLLDKPTTGIFIKGATKEKIVQLSRKIAQFSSLKLEVWYSEDENYGAIYCISPLFGKTAISQAFHNIFTSLVNFVNKGLDEVKNYDLFKGSDEQWINVDQLINTKQEYFFIVTI